MTSGSNIDLLGLGIAPVDFFMTMKRYPRRGTKIEAIPESHLIAGGGPVATSLCTFSRLGGGKASFITSIGDDVWGKFTRKELDRFGVDHSNMITRRSCSSALAFAWIEAGSAERTIVLDMSPRLYITPRDINLKKLPVPRLIHLDGRHVEACLKLARWGKKVGAKIMLDIGSVRNPVDPLFPHVDYFVCADNYALNYFRTRSIEKAAAGFRKMGIPEVVVTAGTAGSFGIDKDGRQAFQKAFRVEAIDTTGAGDVYHGAYLFGISRDWPLDRKMKFASAAAALKCLRLGARDGIPTYRRAISFMNSHRLFHD